MQNVQNEKSSTIYNTKNKKSNNFNLNIGQIVSATITKKNENETFIKTSDEKTLQLNTELYGNVGETVYLKVLKNKNNNLTLEQINYKDQSFNKELFKQKIANNILDLFEQSKLIKEEKNIFDFDEESQKSKNAIAQIRRNLQYSKNNYNKNIINELISNGISLDKISLNILNSALKEMEVLKLENPDSFETDYSQESIKQILTDKGFPLTDKNISSLNTTLKTFNDIKSLDESSILSLIKSEKTLSLENIYKTKYSSQQTQNNISKNSFDDLESQIEKLLNALDIDINQKTLYVSKKFIENEIPINKENIDKYLFLNELDENINIETILNSALSSIKNEQSISDIHLPTLYVKNEIFSNYKNLILDLKNINPMSIDFLLQNNIQVNLRNLINFNQNTTSENQTSNQSNDISTNFKTLLSQIQFKLTNEAAQRLSNKNIVIDTIPMKKALDELIEIEKENYTKNLKIMDVENSNENLNTINTLFDKLKTVSNIDFKTYKNIFDNKISFSINGIENSIINSKLLDYEIFGTKANRKYGDSFNSIKNQIPTFLENMGLINSEENISAFTILSKNNIEVTHENLTKVKVIDTKINELIKNLHPNIVAKMIGDNINPYESHVDDVLDYIDKFNDMFGKNCSDNLVENILKFDESKIDESKVDESKVSDNKIRESMIAMYRVLNIIQKNNFAGIGVILKTNEQLTVENLFQASKYFQKSNGSNEIFDKSIDDNFGLLTEKIVSKNNLNSILKNEDKHLENKIYNNKNCIKNIIEHSNPIILEDALKQNNAYMSDSLEVFNNKLETLTKNYFSADILSTNKTYKNNIFGDSLKNIDPKTIEWLESNNILPTFLNISLCEDVKEHKNLLSTKIDELELNSFIENENILNENGLSNLLEKIDEKNEISNFKNVENLKDLIVFHNFINKKSENNFTIPVKINDKTTNLNMYIVNQNLDEKTDTKIIFSLSTQNLGNVNLDVTVIENNVDIKISSDRKNSLEILASNKDFLINTLKDSGYFINTIEYIS